MLVRAGYVIRTCNEALALTEAPGNIEYVYEAAFTMDFWNDAKFLETSRSAI